MKTSRPSLRHRHQNRCQAPLGRKVSDTFLGGQVVLEYFIIFAAVALLTLIGLSTVRFDDNVRESVEGFVTTAANRMAN